MNKSDEPKKLSSNQERKKVLTAGISEKVEKSKAMVFTNYQGMTHKQLEELKKALKKSGAELTVTKNTLLKRALGDRIPENEKFDLPTATLFAYEDPIAPLKDLAKLIKTLKMPSIKFGIFSRGAGSGSAREDWDFFSEAEILKLSALPSKDVLLAQLVGNLKGPLFGLHRALSWNIQQLVLTLKAIEIKKASS